MFSTATLHRAVHTFLTPSFSERLWLARRGEYLVARAYQKQGFRVVERNWRNRFGELDIICRRRSQIVVVEVKTRWYRPGRTIDIFQSLTAEKQRRLSLLAESYLLRRYGPGLRPDIRVDGAGVYLSRWTLCPVELRVYRGIV